MTAHLKSVNKGSLGSYGYDGNGKRVKKTESGTTTYYVISSVLGSAMEVTSAGVQRAYVMNGGSVVAQLNPNGNFYWLHLDHLGSGRKMTDSTGAMTYRAEFDPYGKLLYEWSSPTNLNTKKFTGYERDAATNLDYAQARMYASDWGRFMTPDPMGVKAARLTSPKSLNRYAYVEGNPVNYTDPTGLYLPSRPYVESNWFWSFFWHAMAIDYFQIEQPFIDTGGGGGEVLEPIDDKKDVGFIENAAKDLSEKKLDSKECKKLLELLGVTADQVKAGAKAANIMNGVGSTVSMSSLYATSPDPAIRKLANTITGTVGDKLATPGTVAVAQLGGPAIYVDPKRFNVADYWTNLSTVFHEVLHNVTGLTDSDIQRKLGLDESKPSHNITEKIKKDCF